MRPPRGWWQWCGRATEKATASSAPQQSWSPPEGAPARPRKVLGDGRWQSPETSTRSWAFPGPPARRRSSALTASWRGRTTPTSTRTRLPKAASRRSRRPTTCCPTRSSDVATTRSARSSARCRKGWMRRPGSACAPGQGGGEPYGQRGGAGRPGQREGESVFFSSDFGDGDFSFGSGDINIEDLLGGMFSRSRAGAGGGPGFGRGVGPTPGADQEAELTLSVEEAYAGGRRTVTLSARGGPRTFEVNIPAGVAEGQRIRLAR